MIAAFGNPPAARQIVLDSAVIVIATRPLTARCGARIGGF
jgi:hypothetical protein